MRLGTMEIHGVGSRMLKKKPKKTNKWKQVRVPESRRAVRYSGGGAEKFMEDLTIINFYFGALTSRAHGY